jgi:TrmH family RNA methyltransferase
MKLSSALLKYYCLLKQKKFRERESKFLIEGFHLIDECLKSGFVMECIIFSGRLENNIPIEFRSRLVKKKIPVYFIEVKQFNKLQETENSQGVIGIVWKKEPPALDSMLESSLLVALDRINDPGNLGTIIRTAYWFGVDGLLVSGDSVDIYNSKVIRSTQGAVFHVNILTGLKLSAVLLDFYDKKYSIYVFTPDGNIHLNNITSSNKSILVFGNEAKGISEELMKKNFIKTRIGGFSNCESLNVSVSCGIALNHFRTQVNHIL